MKVIAVNGSPRPQGATAQALEIVLAGLAKDGIETETIHVGGGQIKGCRACYFCHKRKTRRCVITDDAVNSWLDKISAADGLLLGSPVYFYDVTSDMKAFIDRAGFVARGNDRMFSRKIGAAVVTMRRMGAVHAIDTLLNFFLIAQMYIVGNPGLLLTGQKNQPPDEEGLDNLSLLGRNMAALLQAWGK
jgi:multimeric flavodoxin WrbA